jgi:hypothetical protein
MITVSYTSVRDTGNLTQTGLTIPAPTGHNEAQLYPDGGAPEGMDITFRIPSTVDTGIIDTVITNITPKPGDIITDSNNFVYEVLQVSQPQFLGAWACKSRRTFVEADLQDIISLKRATVNVDAWGSKVPSYATTSGIQAKIQPWTQNETDVRGKRDWTKLFWLYLPTDIEFGNKDLIVDANNQTYEIETSGNQSVLGQIQRTVMRITP